DNTPLIPSQEGKQILPALQSQTRNTPLNHHLRLKDIKHLAFEMFMIIDNFYPFIKGTSE
ncbi:hypothetical protein, partial [uncultured Parabacteroides sp.]|uniref:hypothetical protein n=1 Tax=uncultured Parabacteroides sp. TaxID=512312 RepID=UPI0025D01F14